MGRKFFCTANDVAQEWFISCWPEEGTAYLDILEKEGITCWKILNLAPNPYALPDEIIPASAFSIDSPLLFFTKHNRNHQWNHC
jgi:hypothetical protein